ncbi:MAG: DUF2341 domain-containing protein [Pseudomonadota bacterium]|nr:DUF2341 domain-containing protein [Pseudomonadota bacterium]
MRKLLALLFCCLPMASFAWWSDDWNFRKEIALDSTPVGADIAAASEDVPVLLRLHLGNFGYFNDTQPDGSDLRVVAGDDKTPLKFHIERYDPVNQMAFIWVRVPRIAGASSADKIHLYYGNQKATTAPPAADTYDASQALVYHFANEDTALADSTANANDAASSTAELTPASLIGGGLKFSGTAIITRPSSASLRLIPAKGGTLSAWVRVDQPQGDAQVLGLEEQGKRWVLGIRGAQVYCVLTGATGEVEAVGAGELTTGEWHHLAATVGGGKLTMFLDGKETGSAAVEPVAIAGSLNIGNSAGGSNGLVGELDEVQVANTARAPQWLAASAKAQGQESPLVVYGADAQREGEDVSYFAITMKNVTIDGWVVIIILAVMFVIAMLVMVSKSVYLAKVKKSNAAFLKEYQALHDDPTALDREEAADAAGDAALDESPFMPHFGAQQDKYRFSTLYRLYHHGVQEMTGRVGSRRSAGARAANTLTPQAIEAIRATMDATMVRMTQKLQAKMVILTIAIAGGPFLGLLGTVVGVMITFAAIAASGDVNVNAIAPGIAAALAATVAGLAVAIPALFGYNWLGTQIKEVNADMRVFVDEFVTRVAEHYA